MATRRVLSVFAVALVLAACKGAPGVVSPTGGPRRATPAASPSAGAIVPGQPPGLVAGPPRSIAQTGAARVLAGEVRLISDHGAGLISDAGGLIISNNTGGLVSNNSGSLVSNNAGNLVSNNSGSLVGKTKYALAQASGQANAQASGRVEALLADAEISVHDAAGHLLTDEKGAPLKATSDARGAYRFEAVLPAENLVLRIKLWNGGVLSAILAKDEASPTLAIDTAATLGASYVLSQYVKGDQKTFDKLPATEAARLSRELVTARALITETPTYEEAALVTLTEQLQQKAPAVAKSLGDIKTLLLGGLGDGKAATRVAINRPQSLHVLADGTLLIGERDFGRVRKVAPDGTLTTWIDGAAGEIKDNLVGLTAITRGADGTLFFASQDRSIVYRLKPGGQAGGQAGGGLEAFVGVGREAGVAVDNGPYDGPAASVAFDATKLAVDPDGTLYVGEDNRTRILAVTPAGQARDLALPAGAMNRRIGGLATAPDGALWLLSRTAAGPGSGLFRRSPGAAGTWAAVGAADIDFGEGDLAAGPDGTVWVLTGRAGELLAVAPDGTRTRHARPDATTLSQPSAVAVGADGAVYVADQRYNQVHRFDRATGAWTLVAGVDGSAQVTSADGLTFNSPAGLLFDDQGRMYVSEGTGHVVKRWDGRTLDTIAGSVKGYGGDGGPALEARFSSPSGMAFRGDELLIIDGRNGVIRSLKDGVVSHVLGRENPGGDRVVPGTAVAADAVEVSRGYQLLVDPRGRIYWSSANKDQVLRQREDGLVEAVAGRLPTAGKQTDDGGDGGPATAAGLAAPTAMAFVPGTNGDELLVADTMHLRIRKLKGLNGAAPPTIEAFAGRPMSETLVALLSLAPNAQPQDDGKAGEALLLGPTAMCYDAAGNLYVAEAGTKNASQLAVQDSNDEDPTLPFKSLPQLGARIRKIAPDGTITTIAGYGGKLFPDDAAADGLGLTTAMAFDREGRLVIVDVRNNAIRILPEGSF